MNNSILTDTEVDVLLGEDEKLNNKLIVWNDDVNSFDFVIRTLIQVCKHTPQQAEQCTLIIHYNGKCSVKEGEMEKLKPMKDAITDRGLNATIE